MSRKVKCAITGEYGTNDTFVKIGTKYYKSQDIYDENVKNKELSKKIIDTVVYNFLNYDGNQVFPSVINKKLKELDFYPKEVILKTIENNSDTITYWMQNKEFTSDYGKVAYIFAIIKNTINDVYKEWKRELTRQSKLNKDENLIIDIDINDNKHEEKDLRKWLEDDEWI